MKMKIENENNNGINENKTKKNFILYLFLKQILEWKKKVMIT